MNIYNNIGWSGNEKEAAPCVQTPQEMVAEGNKFRKIHALMVKFLNLSATGPIHYIEAGLYLDLIEHLWGYVKGLRNGVVIGAGDGIRQNRLNLFQDLTILHAAWKILMRRTFFTGTFYQMTNFEIEIVIICRFV